MKKIKVVIFEHPVFHFGCFPFIGSAKEATRKYGFKHYEGTLEVSDKTYKILKKGDKSVKNKRIVL